jgi:hypothetical protein
VRVLTATDDRTIQAYDPAFLGGVNVTMDDVDGDGTADIISPCRGPGGHVTIDAVCVTDNVAEFKRVPALRLRTG